MSDCLIACLLAPFDVVVVPLPSTDRITSKRRPALALSSSTFNQKAQHCLLAMITSAGQSSWPGDHFIEDLDMEGLPNDCVVRLKLFTLSHRLVIRKARALGTADQKSCGWLGRMK